MYNIIISHNTFIDTDSQENNTTNKKLHCRKKQSIAGNTKINTKNQDKVPINKQNFEMTS